MRLISLYLMYMVCVVATWYDCSKDCNKVNVGKCQSQNTSCAHMDKGELKKRDTGNVRMVDANQLNNLNSPRVNLTDAEFERLVYVTKFVEENMESD